MDVGNRLEGEGYKLTLQRRWILQFLKAGRGHYDASEIYEGLKRSGRRVSLATVYRTLEVLSRLNLTRHVDVEGQPRRYELSGSPLSDYHPHLVCTKCGSVVDMSPELWKPCIRRVEREWARTHGFRVTGCQVICYGVCSRCASS